MDSKQTRRDFLKGVAATGAGLVFGDKAFAALKPSAASIVVLVRNAAAQNADHEFAADVIKKMVFQAVRTLSGASSDKAAWGKYFRRDDVVGIKINCLCGKGASTHPDVVAAVTDGIQLVGIKPENIIVWDRSDGDMARSGYEINRGGDGVQYYGTNRDYEAEATKKGSYSGHLSKILTEKITALVNVPILKDHGTAGVTIAFKNHYGSIDNPGAHHGNNCDPYMADLNSVPAIKDKTRLIICEAIRPLCNGGPSLNSQYLWEYNGILAATDPVALDYHGWRIIEERRKEVGLRTLADSGRPVRHLETGAKLGLGINDPAKIRLVTVG